MVWDGGAIKWKMENGQMVWDGGIIKWFGVATSCIKLDISL